MGKGTSKRRRPVYAAEIPAQRGCLFTLIRSGHTIAQIMSEREEEKFLSMAFRVRVFLFVCLLFSCQQERQNTRELVCT